MDEKSAWSDNIFIEQLWRSIGYEKVDLKAYDSVSNVRKSLVRFLALHNSIRPHSELSRFNSIVTDGENDVSKKKQCKNSRMTNVDHEF